MLAFPRMLVELLLFPTRASTESSPPLAPPSSFAARCPQATCREGVGWYVLVLTLSALLCICCFLTMARKFVSVWHERRWLAAGGDLVRPLLGDEDAEEQAHEVTIAGVFLLSLTLSL